MFTNFDCDCFCVADRKALIQTLSILPEYLRNQATESGAVIDYRDWHIPLGRRFRSLKLWFVIRHYGVEGLQHHVRRHVQLAQQFANGCGSDSRFETGRARAPEPGVLPPQAAATTPISNIMDRLNRSGDLYLTHTRLNGKLDPAALRRPDEHGVPARRESLEANYGRSGKFGNQLHKRYRCYLCG